jgi:trimeric autotransporter adhesin
VTSFGAPATVWRGGRRPAVAAAVTVAVLGLASLAWGGAPTAAAAVSGQAAPDVLSTFAGGVGGPALATSVATMGPCGVAYAAGHVYFSDSYGPEREVSTRTDWLTTPAGDVQQETAGPYREGGLAVDANVQSCGTPAVDHAGNLVLPDTDNDTVRVVASRSGIFYGQKMIAGHIYNVAGTTGLYGLPIPGLLATKARLLYPVGVAVDRAGNLVVADSGSTSLGAPALVVVVAVRTGSFYGQKMKAGHIYVIAGAGGLDLKVSGSGGPAFKAGLGPNIGELELDGAGNIVFADSSGNSIRVVAARSGIFYGRKMTGGYIYRVAGDGRYGYSGDSGPATEAGLTAPAGVAVDRAGNLVVADTFSNRVRVVAARSGTFYGKKMTAGHIYTIAGGGAGLGDGRPAVQARLRSPDGVAFDGAGNVVVADYRNNRVRVVATRSGTFYGQQMTAGDIYTVAGNGTEEYSGDGGPATRAELSDAEGVTVIGEGNVAVADSEDNVVRIVAARSGTFYGQQMTAGDIYTVAGNGTEGYSGDGGPATSAELNGPEGVAVDGAGNLVVADNFNNRLRVVAARSGTFYGVKMTAGDIYTVAGNGAEASSGDGGPATKASLDLPETVAVDKAGNLVECELDRIRVVAARPGTFYGVKMTAGDIYTVAGNGAEAFSGDGGPATKASLNLPSAAALDGAGNILIADSIDNRIRVVAARSGTFYGVKMTADDIYTVAGSGPPDEGGFSGDGGPATKARMSVPQGVAVDAAGNLLISDTWNTRVRVVAARSGTFYGVKMTADDIYTIAGDGTTGFSGGGPATHEELIFPLGLAVTPAGNVLIADSNWVRSISG